MNLSRIAIYRPVTTLMLTFALMFLGIISYRELVVQRLPEIEFPALFYAAWVEDVELSPEETNDLLTRPVEKLVASLPGVTEMQSQTHQGRFWGYANFEFGTDMRFRQIELQDKVRQWIGGQQRRIQVEIIPESMSEDAGRLMELILSVPPGEEGRTALMADNIRRKLRSIDGVARVEVEGQREPYLILEAHRDELLARDMDLQTIVDAINRHAPRREWLGELRELAGRRQIILRHGVTGMEQLLQIGLDRQSIWQVRDLAVPQRQAEIEDRIFRIDGKEAVRISVQVEPQRNLIRMARSVRARVAELRTELAPGFALRIHEDQARELERLVANVTKMAASGALLAMLVLFVFTRNFRVALVIAVTIPASILTTFNVMYLGGISINILTLLGLAAGVGMLVDNSIVVVENVLRHGRIVHNRREAAWRGSREVARAIVISTATNLVVFVPLLFADDLMGMVMRQMALSLIFPLTVSLFIAMTLIPMLTSRLIRSRDRCDTLLLTADRRAVRWNPWQRPDRMPRNLLREFVFYTAKGAMRHPVRLLSALLIVIVITFIMAGIKVAVQGLSAHEETRHLTLYGRTPLGSTIDEADAFFKAKEDKLGAALRGDKAIESFRSSFDSTGGSIELLIAEPYRKFQYWEFMNAYRQKLEEGDEHTGFRLKPFGDAAAAPSADNISQLNAFQGAEQFLVTGEHLEAMRAAATQIDALLKADPEVTEVFIENPESRPEVHYLADLDLFRVMKADPSSVSSFFQAREASGIDTNLELREGDLKRRVKLRLAEYEEDARKAEVRHTLTELRRVQVALTGGGSLPLEMLGTFRIRQSVPSIMKHNRRRDLAVSCNLKKVYYNQGMERQRQDVMRRLERQIAALRLPAGVSVRAGGALEQTRQQAQTWKSLLRRAVLALYLMLAFFFESLLLPLIILLTLPLAAIGGILGIIGFNATLDPVAMTGTVILAGVVVNNAILLVEYIRQMRRERGWSRPRAVLAAVNYRFRPILMTSLTTVLGLLPIAFSSQAGREARALVAVLVGGILGSALLTLVVVPAFYNATQVLGERWQARRRKKSGASRAGLPLPRRVGDSIREADFSIEICNVTKIYPRFNRRKLICWIPSRTYCIGSRPPRGTYALKEVSLRLEPGMFGLLGPNGAGKTTLMKILTGMIEPTYGFARIGGIDLRHDRRATRHWISYLPQDFGVYTVLTLEQYLEFYAPFYGLDDRAERRRRIGEVIEYAGLSDVRDLPMKRYSGGMRQRAGIAQMLLRPCPIMIVDEPTAGLDPVERVRFRLLLSQLARTRIVVLSTHIVDDITSSCREVAILNGGQVVYQGDVERIRRAADGMIWDMLQALDAPSGIETRNILFKRHLNGNVLYHYFGRQPLPGSRPVEPTLEDAYVALLIRHQETNM